MKEQFPNNPDHSRYWLPVVGRLMKDIDRSVGKIGFQQTAARILKLAGVDKFIMRGKDQQTKDILERESVVVVANHPSYAEIIQVIASLEPRDDIYLIGIANFLGLGPNITKQILPIHMTKQMASESYKFPIWLGDMLHIGPRTPFDEAHGKNILSITSAVEKVKGGGLVVIFPEGIQSKQNKRWLDGIGYLLAGIGKETNTFLINVYSSGTGSFDYLRLAPGIKNLFPSATITFAEPRSIQDVLEKSTDPKTITRDLENDYNNWVNSLSGTIFSVAALSKK